MQLGVDSASCQKCHAETYKQWQDSAHGQANVQCISCHLSHSQEFRLTDEALCTTCHQRLNDFNHATHAQADLACTDCHVSSMAHTSSVGTVKGDTPPNHSFLVTSEMCVSCHEKTAQSAFQPVNRRLVAADPTPELVAKLKSIEQTNQSLKAMSVSGLGLGLGIGGMLGITFMMVIGTIHRRSTKL
jgi:formate-dependent nitrite reductase cytochrome c552 subunit